MLTQFTHNMSGLIADMYWGVFLAGSRGQGLGCDLHPPHSTQHTRRSAANNRRRPTPGKLISSNMQAPKFYVGSKNLNAEHGCKLELLERTCREMGVPLPRNVASLLFSVVCMTVESTAAKNACQSSEQGIRLSEK